MRTNLKNLALIIIDEMSLVGSDMLYRIHMRLKDVFGTPVTVPFGGINVVLVGDLLQLPPVKSSYIFSTPNLAQFEGLASAKPLWKEFKPLILKKNHRQGEDKVWVDALNDFRKGIVTDEGEKILRSRVTSEPMLDKTAMHIFYYREHVKNHNETLLNSLPNEIIEVEAVQAKPKGCKSLLNPKKGTIGQTSFFEKLQFKIGARCSMVFNINLMDDLYNGACGTIIGVELKGGQVDCIIVQFDDAKCGREQRLKYPYYSQLYKERNGTPIFRYKLEHQLSKTANWRSAAKAELLQFPLRINYAQTSHRMQACFYYHNLYLSLC